ncbi:MAG TPA: DUF2344 domain-containing protein [Candidatus Avoscillospira avicola]|uniref:DUF2344 domain-containing protein n=1 Tax=Candidatus Avoscillospira avicola TaxID=2840706 RepID=A0A9D1DI68_9FIRM|nr:DUF2344 domain-containing protein [Candidatus Avoscillospira avicola]
MSRLRFEKLGDSIYISHLDLMRVFQRAFRRAGLLLRHSQGFTPRAIVSIALPLSVGVESECELLDYQLEQEAEVTPARLNAVLPEGIRVLEVYEETRKIKELTHLRVNVALEYDATAPETGTVEELFARPALVLEKRSKTGTTEVDIRPMVQSIAVSRPDTHTLLLDAVICAQNPSLNPQLLAQAVETYLPDAKPDFVRCRRMEVLDSEGNVFR